MEQERINSKQFTEQIAEKFSTEIKDYFMDVKIENYDEYLKSQIN